MFSSQPCLTSSATSPSTRRRRRSRFTYKQLSALVHGATNCPLRVIAHIDLDAFYAQCETVRLGLDPSKPLAVQQWQGLIAINYPARAYGLNRHVPITEAKEKCPDIICVHVATWKEGDTTWSYTDEAHKEIATRKVSLDPYRIESRKILALIKQCLPKEYERVEKASIDEVFLDLSAQVHSVLLERYPELGGPPPYDDPTEPLPRPHTTALDWAADALVDLDSTHSEEDDPDWDDICMLIASEIVRDIRARILSELHFTCSAGIGRNKMLAKLGSGYKKPNSQTVIRNRAVQHFLNGFKFTKIRNLGGKLGDEVVATFNTELVSDLIPVPIEQLKKQLGDDTGSWLYGVLRGDDNSEVNPRTQIKSMLSAKSFRPSINNFDVACKWLRIFVADIFSRLVEEGVLDHKRRPKTINLHHRQGAQTKSKQAPIPMGRQISEEGLFELAKNLLAQVIVDGRAWPCANLSLSVGGFEDGVTNNKGIGGFLVHGEEAKALNENNALQNSNGRRPDTPPNKKRRVYGERGGIAKFFGIQQQLLRFERAESDAMEHDRQLDADNGVSEESELATGDARRDVDNSLILDADVEIPSGRTYVTDEPTDSHVLPQSAQLPQPPSSLSRECLSAATRHQATMETYRCPRCSNLIPLEEQTEHEDFHFAQDLQDQHSSPARLPPKPSHDLARPRGGGRGGKGKRGRPHMTLEPERGQKRLAFE